MSEDAVKQTADNLAIGQGKPGPGRPKGSTNRATRAVKDSILDAAEALGGTDRLVEWAKSDPKNESVFWAQIYTKVLPKELTGPEGEHLFPREIRVTGVRPA